MPTSTPTITRPRTTYEWDVANAPDIEHHENSNRLTVRPRTIKIHAGGWLQSGELWACVEGQRVRQSDGELGGVKSANFADTTRHREGNMEAAPGWVLALIEQVRAWEAARS